MSETVLEVPKQDTVSPTVAETKKKKSSTEKDTNPPQDKDKIILEFLESGKTITAWCKETGKIPQTLLGWLEKEGYRMSHPDENLKLYEQFIELLKKHEPEEYRRRIMGK